MPGNGVGDRVHNFFAQDNLSQGPRSQVGDGNWPLNDNLWAGNQKQFGVSDSSPRNFNPQQETERGHGSQRVTDPHLFNIAQTNARPEFAKNGYLFGRQNFQTRPDEANFLGVDTEYNRNNVNQRGFPFYESQPESVPEEPQKNPFRSEPSEPHSGFDLFGGQHQMNNQYPGFMQPLQHQNQHQQQQQQQQQQQSGFGDIQQLQQQLMLRKMQELQRQELQRQEEIQIRQQNSLNQASLFARQGLGNGGQTSDWAELAGGNTNWLQRGSPAVQGSSGGLAFSPEQGQPQRSMGFAHQQVDQSLYGVPVRSQGSLNQYMATTEKPPIQQPPQPYNHYAGLVGPSSRPVHDLMVNDKSATEASSSHGEAALDPDEEKILFGSDDNIWEAFGSSKNTGGGVASLLDDNEYASGGGLPSRGTWSALMQSAVAETSSGGGGVQEEWPDLNFQNPELSLPKQDDINLPNPNPNPNPPVLNSHDERLSKQQNNWLNRGVQERKGNSNSQMFGNNKQNHWSAANESVPPVNTGFNMNENQSDWKRVMLNGTGTGQGNVNPSVNRGVAPNLSGLQGVNQMTNQFSANNHHLNYWKHVDSSVKSKGSENSEKSQGRMNKGPQVSESSFNSSDKEDLKMHERENSNDSYRSSSSHLPNTLGPRDTFSSDGGESRALTGTKQSLTNRKASGSRKFQYHPMGNLDEDVGIPYGSTRQGSMARGLGQDHGNFGHLKTSPQIAKSSEMGKGSHDTRFKGMIPGHVPDLFTQERSVASDKASQPSQNMLELLHKVDQTRQLNSLERNLSSEIPEPENSDGSFGGHQKSQSSNSQGIGLQLGPPSQRVPLPSHASPRANLQTVKPNSLNQPNSRGKGHANLSPFSPFQETSHDGEFKNDRVTETPVHKMVTNFSSALGPTEFSNSRNQLQNQDGRSGEKLLPAAQPHVTSSAFPKMLPNAWTNLPTQQLFSAAQARKPTQSNLVTSHPLNIVESNSLSQQNVEEIGGSSLTKESPAEKVDRSQITDDSNPSATSQRDIEAFGRSLKPNNHYSLLNQMQTMKNTENDPMKRLKDQDNLFVGQQVAPWSGQPVPHQDSSNLLSKQVVLSDQNGSQSRIKVENSQVTPQTGPSPSWFDQSGTRKTSQMMSQVADAGSLETHDPKVQVVTAPDASQVGVVSKPPGDQLPAPQPQTNIVVQTPVPVKPKKRKFSTEVRPWVKEVTGDFKNLQDIYTASMEWCEATNRLMEKVEDDGEVIEDVPRPKKRIILTTHLMQQLFPPPPAKILSSDATSHYESVVFYAARVALGDTCNLSASNDGSNPQTDKSKEVVEDCTSKSKKLENDFSRMDKRASILDLRVECQDLEKFSIINRFAKFHGRGQADGEGSSLSDGAANAVPKPFPQRYVIAVPLPKNLPERVQCLSL